MINVIRHGDKRRMVCPECNCIFTYQEEDIERKKKERLRAKRSGQENKKRARKAADVPERAQRSQPKRQAQGKGKAHKEQRVR